MKTFEEAVTHLEDWVEECTCDDPDGGRCWYHLSDEQRVDRATASAEYVLDRKLTDAELQTLRERYK